MGNKAAGESFTIQKPDGLTLAALRFPSREVPARAEIIICHGFSGGKENGGRIHTFAGLLNNIGINVTAFDFTGSGGSEGDFSRISLSRQAQDLAAVMDYVTARSPLPMVLLGRSFGGSTCLVAGPVNPRTRAFIYWSTPVHLYGTFSKFIQPAGCDSSGRGMLTVMDERGEYRLDAELFRDFDRYDMETYARSMAAYPVLVVHGGQDLVVEPYEARYLAGVSGAKLHLITEADHQFTRHTVIREQITISWLKEILPRIETG